MLLLVAVPLLSVSLRSLQWWASPAWSTGTLVTRERPQARAGGGGLRDGRPDVARHVSSSKA